MIALPFFAIGVALLALLVAYALAVILTPVIEGLARNVPVVGGYIARGLDKAVRYAEHTITGWADTGIDAVAGWLGGLHDAWSDFVDAVNAFIVELPDRLDHLLHVAVHDVVHAFVDPVRDALHDVKVNVDALLASAGDVFTQPLSDFQGIEAGVRDLVDHARDAIRNVDLPDVLADAEATAAGLAGAVEGQVHDLHDAVYSDIGALFDQLGKIPLTQLLEGLTAIAGTAALVDVIAAESGLSSRACRAKVRGICSTDPLAWQALLDVAGLALAFVGIEEFVRLAQDLARDTLPQIGDVLSGG